MSNFITGACNSSFALGTMKFSVATILSVVCFLFTVKQTQCVRILAIIPTPSYSHQIPYRPLWIELNKRGHEVVLITPNPISNLNLTKFRQIDIGASYKVLRDINFVQHRFDHISCLKFIEDNILPLSEDITHHVLNHTDVIKLYAPNSNEHFDLIMAELLFTPAVYAFAHRFNAPLIGLTSLGTISFNDHIQGGLVLPSHEATWEMEDNTGSNLPFWKRLQNYVNLWHNVYILYNDFMPRQQKLAEQYFGPDIPSLLDIQKNISVVFVNEADAMTPARPKLTNVITFTSFHVDENPKPLPKDLKHFVDNAREGFIYFSLGSNARSSDLPRDTLQVFLDVFAKLPYKVVWKFEKDLPGKPKNVFIGSWFPQQSILAHPNIKLFIYQGGLQSSEEAVHFTVPLLGFPVLADQAYQSGRMEALGVGKRLDLTSVTRAELESAIKEIITDKQYKKKMIELKKTISDRPYDLMEHLAWWTEYVIRHKGAPHLRTSLARQPWYQRYDMDVIVFLTTVASVIVSITLVTTVKLIVYLNKTSKSINQKHKIN